MRSYGDHLIDHYVQLVVAICKKGENGIVPFGTVAKYIYIYLVAHLFFGKELLGRLGRELEVLEGRKPGNILPEGLSLI